MQCLTKDGCIQRKGGDGMFDYGWSGVNENLSIADTLGIDQSAPNMNLTESPWENGGDGEETLPIKSGW